MRLPWDDPYSRNWEPPREARGKIEIPAGVSVQLKLTQEAAHDLSPLAELPFDALDELDLHGLEFSDEQVRHVAGLTGMKSIDLSYSRVGDNGVAHLAGLTYLVRLNLHGSGLGDRGMAALSRIPNLEHLEIGQTYVTDAGLSSLTNHRSLGSLQLASLRITDEGLAAIEELTALEDLTIAKMSDEFDFSDERMPHLAKLTRLKNLYIVSDRVSDNGLRHLSGLKSLHHLRLQLTKASGTGLQALAGLPLKSIDLPANVEGDAGADAVAAFPDIERVSGTFDNITDAGLRRLATLARLKSLSLSNPQLTPAGLSEFANFRALGALTLENCSQLEAILPALRDLESLETLTIQGGSFAIAELASLAEFPRLRRLTLMLDNAVVDGVRFPQNVELPVLSELKRLEYFSSAGPWFSGRNVARLAQLPNLTTLFCWQSPIGDDDLPPLHSAPRLTALYLDGAPLTDRALTAIAVAAGLKEVRVDGDFSDSGLMELRQLASLKSLSIGGRRLTEQGFDVLRSAMPSVDIHNGGRPLEYARSAVWAAERKLSVREAIVDRIRFAIGDARRERLRVMLVLADKFESSTVQLSAAFDQDVLEKPLRDYEQIWHSVEDARQAAELSRELNVDFDGLSPPLLAVLDAQGKLVAVKNVATPPGAPADVAALKEFIDMLKSAAPKMTDQEIAELRASLRSDPIEQAP